MIQVSGIQVSFSQRSTIDQNLPLFDPNNISRKADNPLNEGLGGILGVPENNDVPSLDVREVVYEAVNEYALLVYYSRQHAGAFHFDRLHHEQDNQYGGDDGKEDVPGPTLQFSEQLSQ